MYVRMIHQSVKKHTALTLLHYARPLVTLYITVQVQLPSCNSLVENPMIILIFINNHKCV